MSKLSRFGISEENEGIESIAVYSVVGLYSLIEKRIVEYLKPYKLSTSQFNALMIIKHKGGEKGLSQIEIGEKLIVSASNMTRLLDKLNKEGLLERFPSLEDRRINYIKITKKGSNLLDQAWPGYMNVIKSISQSMTDEELDQLSALSLKWFDNLVK